MKKSDGKNLLKQNDVNQATNQTNSTEQTNSETHLINQANRPDPNLSNVKWTKLEQKLLFSLLLQHFVSWKKYACCFLKKTRADIHAFVLEAIENLKSLEYILILKLLNKNTKSKGKSIFFSGQFILAYFLAYLKKRFEFTNFKQ